MGSSPCECQVRRFWEKPSPARALACLQAGRLWSTFVLVAKASALVAAGARCLPVLHERLAAIERLAGGEDEPWGIQQAYAHAPRASFSRAVLEACPSLLAVCRLPPLTWCDLGDPERVMRTLASTGLAPAWLAALGEPA
jgi:mannose-1-phosphate guanylyltransferase